MQPFHLLANKQSTFNECKRLRFIKMFCTSALDHVACQKLWNKIKFIYELFDFTFDLERMYHNRRRHTVDCPL